MLSDVDWLHSKELGGKGLGLYTIYLKQHQLVQLNVGGEIPFTDFRASPYPYPQQVSKVNSL